MTYTFRALTYTFALLLAGCAKEAPPSYIAGELPDIPDHCDLAKTPNPPEIKLPNTDVTDVVAAKDRLALKGQIRTLKSYRQTCSDQLQLLLKSKERPTS